MLRQANQSIVIDARIKTTLEDLDKNIKTMQSKLKEGVLQTDLTKGVGKDLSKLFSRFETGFSKINQLTPKNLLDLGDSKEFQRNGADVIKTIREIQRITSDIGTKSIIDVKKLFPNAFDERVGELQNSIINISNSFEQLSKKQGAASRLNAEIVGLTSQITELDAAAQNKSAIEKNWTEAKQALDAANSSVEQLRVNLQKQIEIKFSVESIQQAEKKIEDLEKELKELTNKGVAAGKGGRGIFQGKGIGDWEKILKSSSGEEKEQASAAIELLRNYNSINTALREQNKLLEDNKKIQELMNSPAGLSDNKNLKEAGKILDQKDQVIDALNQQALAADRATQSQNQLAMAENASAKKQELQQKIAEKTAKLQELNVVIQNLTSNTDLTQLVAKFKELTGIQVEPTKDSLQIMLRELTKIDQTSYNNLIKALRELGILAPKVKEELYGLGAGFKGAKKDAEEFINKAEEMKRLKNQIAYFFGLTNAIQLFRRALRGAMNTVKELDKTMTEAAVVTEFSVGDMWGKMPEYSAQAQKLGVSINGMYQATTLYYQQGLKTNEAMALGVETMKMAKIAGLESTDATKAMTAALRGFNMELNELSATRVNDVYSQLAAVTAADVNQISTAMEKTASIAASANMEFETTAALLAQIIETTQEAPETAGTAMKTIIARFSEVKELRSKGMMTSEDEEGEIIDVNKIDKALRSVGVSMKDFFNGTEGLDSILLKLAEKWGDLDFETQRYIATMAAGSRQQSRFIAMMSDHARTIQLVDEANSSAGASQRQYEKTLDSMESKLQKLKNAWDEFLMGLANNKVLKGAVDFLTFILTSINKVIDALSGGNGLVQSIFSLIAVLKALSLGRAAANKMFSGAEGGILGAFLGSAKQKIGSENDLGATIIPNPRADGTQAGTEYGEGVVDATVASIQGGAPRIKAALNKTINGPSKRYTSKTKRPKKLNTQSQEVNTNNTAEGTKDLNKEAKGATEEVKGLNKETGKTGENMDKVVPKVKQTSTSLNEMAATARTAGMAAVALGGALGMLAKHMEDTGKEGLAETMQILSTAISGAGVAVMFLIPMLPQLSAGFSGAGAAGTAAGISVQTAWWPVLLITLAIAALLATIILVVKTIKEVSDTGRLERLDQTIQELGDSAEEAKNKLEQIGEAQDGLEGLRNTVAGLVKGTREWKRALIENNQEVLKLINTYPQLMDWVDKGEFGELIIKSEGWDELIERQNEAYLISSSAQQAAINNRDIQALANEFEYHMSSAVLKTDGYRQWQYHEFGEDALAYAELVQSYKGIGEDIVHFPEEAQAWQLRAIQDTAKFFSSSGGKWVTRLLTATPGAAKVGSELATAINKGLESEFSGGLGYNKFGEYLGQLAERGVSFADGIEPADEEIMKQVYDELGLEVDFDYLKQSVEGLGEDFDELALSALQVSEAEKAQEAAILENAVAQSEFLFGSQYADQAISSIGEIKDISEEIRKEAESGKTSELDDDELKKQYAEISNLFYENGKIYSDSSMENELDVSEETMRIAVATKEISKDMTKAMEDFVRGFEKVAEENRDLAANLFSEEGIDLSYSDIEELKYGGNIINKDSIYQALGFDSFEQLAESFGLSQEEAVKLFEKNTKAAIERNTRNIWKITNQLKKSGNDYYEALKDGTVKLEEYVQQDLLNIVETFENIDESLITKTFELITKDGGDLNTSDLSVISDFINDIDWSNPIEAAHQLDLALQSNNETISKYAKALKDLNSVAFGTSAQMNYLFNSAEFIELSDEIAAIIKETGKIDSSNIREWTKDCKDLKKVMEQTGVTSAGLAAALTLIQKQDVPLSAMTDTVWSFFESFQSLDEVVYNIIDKIENFDFGIDENQISEFIKELYETLSNNINKGAYGNSQNQKIIEWVYGKEGLLDEEGNYRTGEAYRNKLNEALKFLEANQGNMYNAWAELAERNEPDGQGLQVSLQNGEVVVTGYDNLTTDEIVSVIAERMGVSEEIAEMMIGDLKNFSDDFHAKQLQEDYDAGIDNVKQNLGEVDGKKFIDKQELSAIAKASGKEEDKILEDIGLTKEDIISLYDENGQLRTNADLIAELEKLKSADSKDFSDRRDPSAPDDDSFSISKYIETFSSTGLSQEKLRELAFETAQTYKHEFATVVNEYGEPITVPITPDMDYSEFQQQYNKLAKDAERSALAEAIAEALADVKITLDSENSEKEAKGFFDTIQGYFDDNKLEINLNAKSAMDRFVAYWDQNKPNLHVNLIPDGYAKGSDGVPKDEIALTGEKGPELVETKGSAYIVGQNGPELAALKKGDKVYTASETKRILSSKHKLMSRYEGGTPKTITGYGGVLKGGSGGAGVDKLDNPFDKLFNILEQIKETTKRREILEHRYEKLLRQNNSSYNELIKISQDQLETLREEKHLQEAVIEGRKYQIEKYQQEKSAYSQYGRIEEDAEGNLKLRIDWDLIDKITNKDLMDKVKDYIDQLQDWADSVNDAVDASQEVDNSIWEIIKRGQDEYQDIESQIAEAIEKQRQDEIDELSNINESINNANANILDSMQRQIDDYRQARDNQKTEEEISDKQKRLAYLQQDTSNMNATEILKLQKEIEEAQENYTDTLIDQKIDELKDQNEQATEQRQHQIDLLQNQLKQYMETGAVWERVDKLLAEATNSDGSMKADSEMLQLLKNANNYQGLSQVGKMDWLKGIETTLVNGLQWKNSGSVVSSFWAGQDINFKTADQKEVTGRVGEDGVVVDQEGNVYKNVTWQGGNSFATTENYKGVSEEEKEDIVSEPPKITEDDKRGVSAAIWNSSSKWGWGRNPVRAQRLAEVFGPDNNIQKDYVDKGISTGYTGALSDYSYENMKKKYVAYRTGGLADFTGPAWLDGTKSKPEYILSANQTKAFFTLIDVLSGLQTKTSSSTEKTGDSVYDIDINVESIGSDYDVEQLANTVKRLINEDAHYRNNNAISLMR